MAREIKKPLSVNETDVKDYAGDIEIDVTPHDEDAAPQQSHVQVLVEQVEVAVAQAASAPSSQTLTFNAWFQKALARNPRVKLSYKEAIEAHCKAVGLESQATDEAYSAALSHFGL